jgi:hypothetical protein
LSGFGYSELVQGQFEKWHFFVDTLAKAATANATAASKVAAAAKAAAA